MSVLYPMVCDWSGMCGSPRPPLALLDQVITHTAVSISGDYHNTNTHKPNTCSYHIINSHQQNYHAIIYCVYSASPWLMDSPQFGIPLFLFFK